jgi:hypothetical protein
MTMSVGLGRIINDPKASILVRKALGTLSTPELIVTDQGVTINDDGKIAIKLNPNGGLAQDADGLSVGVANTGITGSTIGHPVVTGFVGVQVNLELPKFINPINTWSYYAGAITIGLGSSVDNAYGLYIADVAAGNVQNVGVYVGAMTNALTPNIGVWVADLAGGTDLNIGFRGEVSSGADKWNVYMEGTAGNYFEGSVGIGDDTLTAKLNVLSTTEQLRLQYDSTKYAKVTVNSVGKTSIEAVGTNADIDLVTSGSGKVTINGLDVPRVFSSSAALTVNLDGTVQEFVISTPGADAGDVVIVSSLLGASVGVLSWCGRAVLNSCIVRFSTAALGGSDFRTWYVKAIRA